MSASDPIFGEAPSDIDLSDTRTAGDNAAVITLTLVAMLAVCLRLWARSVQRIQLRADDYLIIVALFFVCATSGLSIAGGFFGAGKHVWTTTTHDILVIILYAYTWIYGCSTSFTKLSVIFFYLRIFGKTDPTFKALIYVATLIAAMYPVMIIAVMLASCQPLHYYWLQYTDPTVHGKCLNINLFFLVAGIINMITDIFILTIPIPKIIKLQMSRRKKVTVVGIMLLGSFVCVSSIVRIYYLVVLQTYTDLTWIMGPVFIWSSVEPAIGILSACLPVLGPLLRIVFHNLLSSHDTKSHTTPYAGGSGGWRNITHTTGPQQNSRSSCFNSTSLKPKSNPGEWHEMGRLAAYDGKLRPDDDQITLTTNGTARHNPKLRDRDIDATSTDIPHRAILVQTHIDQDYRSARDVSSDVR